MTTGFTISLLCAIAALAGYACGQANITGERRIWHKITLTFDGPERVEESSTYRDYKLTVIFSKGSRTFVVPGYFAADGNSAETGAESGNKWRVHFAPDATGRWSWSAEFVTGVNAAYDDRASVEPVGVVNGVSIHGSRGSFRVNRSNKGGIDNRGKNKGRLQYVGKQHLKWSGSDKYFMKFGADSPENFLAYTGFDGTPDIRARGMRKNYTAHIQDYNDDGELWRNLGHGIFGALNYLAAKGVNVHSFLTGNIGGDDKNVFMYVSNRTQDRDVFDVSKLDQWERVFEHMDKKGMYLHFKTQETENDGGIRRGVQKTIFLEPDERMLYYRELIARFSHHLALNWNVGEENTNTPEEQDEFSNWISDLDPYKHNIVIHSFPSPFFVRQFYGRIIANLQSNSYTGASLQLGFEDVHDLTLELVTDTASTIRPWVVACDETGPATRGISRDSDTADPNHDEQRPAVIYGNIMAGGAGIETYTGAGAPAGDQQLEDYRLFDQWWSQGKIALDFFEKNGISFQDMVNADSIADSNAWVLRGRDTIVVYIFSGTTTTLNLSDDDDDDFSVSWYSPTRGGSLRKSSTRCIRASGASSLGGAPIGSNPDWIVVLERNECQVTPEGGSCFAPSPADAGSRFRSAVFMEAENAESLNDWDTGLSGDVTYVTWTGALPNIGSRNGVLTYNFTLPVDGAYYLNMRLSRGSFTGTKKKRSVGIRMDGEPVETAVVRLGRAANGSKWNVFPRFIDSSGSEIIPRYPSLTAGKHTLEIIPLEADVWIDELYILPFDLREGRGAFGSFAEGPSTVVLC